MYAFRVCNQQTTKDIKQQQFIFRHCSKIATNDCNELVQMMMIIVIAIVFEDGVGGRRWWGGNSQLTLGCNKLTVTAPLSLQDHDNDMEDIMQSYTAERCIEALFKDS